MSVYSNCHVLYILQLEKKATVNQNVKVLELPKKYGKMPAGLQCQVAGWGKRVLGTGAESVLYEAHVKLDKAGNCKSIWQQYYNQDQMTCSVSDGRDGFCQVSCVTRVDNSTGISSDFLVMVMQMLFLSCAAFILF